MKSLFVLRVLLIISFVAGAVLVSPGTVNAASLSEPQIQSILNLLQVFGADSSAVQNVEKALRGESTSAAPQETRFCYSFTRNFGVGTMGADVRALAQALQKEGVYSGQITSTFTEPLASAVVEFQEKYQQDVLGPWGLTRGTGFMGGTTRAKLNALYGCGVAQVSSPTPIPIPSPTPPVTSVVAPVITSISPNSASQGVDRANMTIFGRNFTGAGTQSGCGLSNVFNNQGFQIVSCKVVSDTLISAQFTVADDATPGVRAINLSTPTGGGSNKVNFTVVAKTSVPSIT
ncbi:MAG: peptidoglycan-binding domain-containing protein, partial [Patescibacteria group bacterium]